MRKPLTLSLFALLASALLVQTGCGVKGDPIPYVRAYPERQPKAEPPPTDNSKSGEENSR